MNAINNGFNEFHTKQAQIDKWFNEPDDKFYEKLIGKLCFRHNTKRSLLPRILDAIISIIVNLMNNNGRRSCSAWAFPNQFLLGVRGFCRDCTTWMVGIAWMAAKASISNNHSIKLMALHHRKQFTDNSMDRIFDRFIFWLNNIF